MGVLNWYGSTGVGVTESLITPLVASSGILFSVDLIWLLDSKASSGIELLPDDAILIQK